MEDEGFYSPEMTDVDVMRVDEAHDTAAAESVPEGVMVSRHEVMIEVLVESGKVVTLDEKDVDTEVDVKVPNCVSVGDDWQDIAPLSCL